MSVSSSLRARSCPLARCGKSGQEPTTNQRGLGGQETTTFSLRKAVPVVTMRYVAPLLRKLLKLPRRLSLQVAHSTTAPRRPGPHLAPIKGLDTWSTDGRAPDRAGTLRAHGTRIALHRVRVGLNRTRVQLQGFI